MSATGIDTHYLFKKKCINAVILGRLSRKTPMAGATEDEMKAVWMSSTAM